MRLLRFGDSQQFLRAAEDFLLRHEAEHATILGLESCPPGVAGGTL